MLPGGRKAARDFFIIHEPDRDATSVIAVVGLGHDRKAESVRRAHGFAIGLHQFLARHRQAQRAKDAVGFFLVARELDRNMRRAARDSRLQALLVTAMAQLDQRLVIEPEPRNASFLGGMHQ